MVAIRIHSIHASGPDGGAYFVFNRRTWGHRKVMGSARAKKVENH